MPSIIVQPPPVPSCVSPTPHRTLTHLHLSTSHLAGTFLSLHMVRPLSSLKDTNLHGFENVRDRRIKNTASALTWTPPSNPQCILRHPTNGQKTEEQRYHDFTRNPERWTSIQIEEMSLLPIRPEHIIFDRRSNRLWSSDMHGLNQSTALAADCVASNRWHTLIE